MKRRSWWRKRLRAVWIERRGDSASFRRMGKIFLRHTEVALPPWDAETGELWWGWRRALYDLREISSTQGVGEECSMGNGK